MLRRFLADKIETFEHLEVVLLFAGAPTGRRTLASIAGELRMPEPAIGEALEHLVGAGVLDRIDDGTFACRPEAVSSLAGLAGANDSDRSSVMRILSTHALERVRMAAVRAFTSASLAGKKPDG